MCPARDHFIFLTVLIISDFCPFPDPDVDLSMRVCDIEHTSFHFGLCGRKFVLCLFGQCQMLQKVHIMEEAFPSTHAKLADIQKALTHNAWSHILFCTRDHWIRYDTCTV